MKNYHIKNFGLFLITSIFSISAYAVSVNTGSVAPEFKVLGSDGKTHSLSDYKDKVVVLEWFNKDCPYVVKHYESKNMQNLQKKYTEQDVVWLSVISSAPKKQGHLSKDQIAPVLKDLGAAPTAVLIDADGKTGKMYDAKTTPHMYIIGKDGTLAYQGAMDDKPSARPSSLKDATPLFANAIDLVIAGKEVPKKLATNDPYGCSVKY